MWERIACFCALLLLAWFPVPLSASLLASTTATTDACEEVPGMSRGRYSALECWLQQLKIPLPKQSFHEGIITLTLHDLACSNITLTGLQSAFVRAPPDSNDKNHNASSQVEMAIQHVSVICRGAYHSSGGFSGKLQAVLGARHKAFPAVELVGTVLAAPGNHSFVQPQHLQTKSCATDMAVVDLQFSGSLSAHTIQLFARQIRSSVTKALSTKICPLLDDALVPLVDRYIAKLNELLEPYLVEDNQIRGNEEPLFNNHQVASPRRLWEADLDEPAGQTADKPLLHRHHKNKKHLVKWSRDAPALVGFLQRMNTGLTHFLKQGLLQHWLDDANGPPRSCGFFFNGINSLMRSVLYDNKGWLDVPLLTRWQNLHFVIPQFAAVRLQIQNVSVHGLDQWDALQLFSPSSDESFLTKLFAHNVTLRTRFHLVLSAVPHGVFKGDELEENFMVDINATSLQTALQLHLNADSHEIHEKVTVGTLWDILSGVLARNSSLPELPCLLDSIDSFFVTDLSVVWAIQSLTFQPEYDGPGIRSNLEEDVDRLINNALQIIWTDFPEMVTQSVRGLGRGPVLNGLNAFFERISTTNKTCTISKHDKFHPHMIDFTDVKFLKQMNDFFGRPSTRKHMNSYLQCGVEYVAAALQDKIPNGLLQMHNISIQNLGNLRDLELLAPSPGSRVLSNRFLFANENSSSPFLLMNLTAGLPQASTEMNLTVRWNDIGASSSMGLQYDLGRLKQYPLFRILERGQCLLAPMNQFDIYDVSDHWGSFSVDLSTVVNYGNSSSVHLEWKSSEAPEVSMMGSTIWTWLVNISRDILSAGTISSISQAVSSCSGKQHSYSSEGSSEDYLSISLVVCAIILLAQPALLMIHSRNDETINLRRREEEQQQYEDALLEPLLPESEHSESPSWESGPKQSLLNHRSISDVVRITVPVLLILAMVLLVCSNVSIGAEVKLKASVTGRTIEAPSLFSFSLYNTAKEMLHAKIYSLLMLVAVFSGFWPYLKLTLMLFGWLGRFSKENSKRREQLFLALDALGKFSLVDTYVLVLMVVAFRYHLELDKGIQIDVFVTPKFGFYGFLMATILSLVLSHVLVFYHRKASREFPRNTGTYKSSLFRHAYQTDTGRKALSTRALVSLLVLFACTCSLLAIGITKESFIFELGGVAGELIGPRKDAKYSLISLGVALPESVQDSSGLAILGLQATYFLFATVAPFACLASLFILYVCPLSLKQQLSLLTCAEVANAWSAVEVFCLSIVAALLEISTFAAFIVGDKCDLIDSILENSFGETADTCYSVSASIAWSVTYLVMGVILNSALVSLVLRLVHTALHERLEVSVEDTGYLDSLAARQITFVERLNRWKATSWILEDNFDTFVQNNDEIEPLSPNEIGDEQPGHMVLNSNKFLTVASAQKTDGIKIPARDGMKPPAFEDIVPDKTDRTTEILPSFLSLRRRTWETLYHSPGENNPQQRDKSPKGSVDEPIQELVNLINFHPSFATLSSCSGRIAIYDSMLHTSIPESSKENKSLFSSSNDRSDVSEHHGKGSTGGWLLASHTAIDVDHVMGLIRDNSRGGSSSFERTLSFEPFLLHVAAANMGRGRQLLQAALQRGFRESGLVVTDARITVAIRSYALSWQIPLHGSLSQAYLRQVLEACNERLRKNHDQLRRFYVAVHQTLFVARPRTLSVLAIKALPPLGLWGHAAVMIDACEDNEKSLMVFGGYGTGPMGSSKCQRSALVYRLPYHAKMDTWGAAWEVVKCEGQRGIVSLGRGMLVEGTKWTARQGLTACFHEISDLVIVFGGRASPGSAFQDLLVFDWKKKCFGRPKHVLGEPPSPRWGHTMTCMADGSIIITGGRDSEQTFSDVHALSFVKRGRKGLCLRWVEIELGLPAPRCFHAAAAIESGRKVFVWGGNSCSEALLPNYQAPDQPPGIILSFGEVFRIDEVSGFQQCHPPFGHTLLPVLTRGSSSMGDAIDFLSIGGTTLSDNSKDNAFAMMQSLNLSHRLDGVWSGSKNNFGTCGPALPSSPVVHHSATLFSPKRNGQDMIHRLAVVGGGVQGFAFGPIFSDSFTLQVEFRFHTAEIADSPLSVEDEASASGVKSQITAPMADGEKATPTFFVGKRDAKALKNHLESMKLIDKRFRMGPADVSASPVSNKENSRDYIAVPVLPQARTLYEEAQKNGMDTPEWIPLVKGVGEQKGLLRASRTFGSGQSRKA